MHIGLAAATRRYGAPITALAAALLVHVGALQCGFHNDDYLHLWEMKTNHWFAFVTRVWAGHIMVLPKLIMLGVYGLFGCAPAPLMVCALVAHLLNTALLWRVTTRFGADPRVAAAFALLWGTSPSHQDVLSWMCTHGFIFGTTTTFAVLNELSRAASEGRGLSRSDLLRVNLFAALGAVSKGEGASVALALPVAIWFLAPRGGSPWRATLAVLPVSLATVVALSRIVGGGLPFDSIAAAIVLTALHACGVAIALAGPILTFTENGVGFENAPLGAGPMLCSLFAALVLAVLVRDFWRSDASGRRTTLGLLALSGAMYGAVAVGRAPMLGENSAFALAIAGRYQYAPTAVLAAIVILAVSRRIALSPKMEPRVVFGSLTLAAIVTLTSGSMAFANTTRETAVWARRHASLTEQGVETLARAQPTGDVFFRNDDFAPVLLVTRMAQDRSVFPGIGAYWALARRDPWIEGRRLRFVDEDPEVQRSLGRLRPATREFFASTDEAERTRARVHSIDELSPSELREELLSSRDPVFARALIRAFAGRKSK